MIHCIAKHAAEHGVVKAITHTAFKGVQQHSYRVHYRDKTFEDFRQTAKVFLTLWANPTNPESFL